MWLRTPEIVENRGKHVVGKMLEPETELAVERAQSEVEAQRDQAQLKEDLRDLPVVSIGRPEVWYLPELYPHDKLASHLDPSQSQVAVMRAAL
jgi:hypothetical protein